MVKCTGHTRLIYTPSADPRSLHVRNHAELATGSRQIRSTSARRATWSARPIQWAPRPSWPPRTAGPRAVI